MLIRQSQTVLRLPLSLKPSVVQRLDGRPDRRKSSFRKCDINLQRRASWRGRRCRAEPYPFKREDYHKCVLQVPSVGVRWATGGPTMGHLIFLLEDDLKRNREASGRRSQLPLSRSDKALIMQIGGDIFHMIVTLLEGRKDPRPFSLDLLWTVLLRGQEVSKRDWKLLHVAIVEIRENTYYARLFFGDPESGDIVWDTDSRPSDACWLALKAECPIFMHKDVWNKCSETLMEMIRSTDIADTAIEVSHYSIQHSDPEPVKRLKREMEVALSEEDYTTAARIRDHPYMKLFKEISDLEKDNNRERAEELRAELDKLIESVSQDPKKP